MKTPREIQDKLAELEAEQKRLKRIYNVNVLGYDDPDEEEDENFDENEHQRDVDLIDGKIESLKFVLN